MRKRHQKKTPVLVPVPWKVGMPADFIADMRKKLHLPFLADPQSISKDENGLVVKWFLPDSTLTMKRVDGRYKVAEIEPNPGFFIPELEEGDESHEN